MKKKINRVIILLAVTGVMIWGAFWYTAPEEARPEPETEAPELTEQEKSIREVMSREEFQDRIETEAEKIYWEEEREREIEEHEKRLERIEKELEQLREDSISF